ncbi:MAG TPA: coenzyme F420-0:L-glutamate ligase, partial [Limnochordia bacterium]|nr:coenzyme F420-0:L-glutamate ligase [Limnochordia bacterium]
VAYAGFEGVLREQGKADLYGRPLQFTERAVADGIAAAAVMCMGESDESTPFAIVSDAPVTFTDRTIEPAENAIDPKIDLFAPIFSEAFARLAARRITD